jgi:amino acid transporter
LLQGAISALLVVGGIITRQGINTIVDYSAPVFWLFFLLTGISLFILRRTHHSTERTFRVPFYPILPLIFCAAALYLLISSLVFAGLGSLFGVAVIAVGLTARQLSR